MFRKLSAVLIIIILSVSCGAAKHEKPAQADDQQPKAEAVAPVHPGHQPDASESSRVTPTVLAIRKIEDSVVNIRTEKTVETNVSPFFNDPFLTISSDCANAATKPRVWAPVFSSVMTERWSPTIMW
ncbi:MAG: hypothetical protein LRY51_06170 [Geovibrio sp.]|nr:hypothetical protein [Geovibrio sp.]